MEIKYRLSTNAWVSKEIRDEIENSTLHETPKGYWKSSLYKNYYRSLLTIDRLICEDYGISFSSLNRVAM
ncbi:MAG: hypothetical protein K5685_09700 [Bacteroidales bacterium]|nr:hypothetical protein [Bacteroidales bacterium]